MCLYNDHTFLLPLNRRLTWLKLNTSIKQTSMCFWFVVKVKVLLNKYWYCNLAHFRAPLHWLQRERERKREISEYCLWQLLLFVYLLPKHLAIHFKNSHFKISIGYALVKISLRVRIRQDGGETTLLDLTWADTVTVTVSNREYSEVKWLTRAATVWTGNQLLSLACLPVRAWVSQTEVTVVIRDDRTIRPFLCCINSAN